MDNQTDIGISFSNKVKGQAKIEKYAQTLKTIQKTLKSLPKEITLVSGTNINKSLSQMSKTLSEVEKKIKDTSTQQKTNNNVFKDGINIISKYTSKFTALTTTMSNLVEKSASYNENINLLDVAYNNNRKSADDLVSTMTEMYGLDESWGYRTVGLFKQLSNAMGFTNENGQQLAKTGDKISSTLTQLAVDLSSLYNTTTQSSVDKLQSALAGNTKPIRAFGADITETSLQQTLLNNDIDTFVRNLSYAEKRLVIITTILNQTNEAQGDFGRTIESVSNQMRIMVEQQDRLSRAWGSMFLPAIKEILPYLNAMLMVLTEIFSTIASLLGYKEEDYFSGITEQIEGLDEGLNNATASAQKLRSGLRSFDKLNNITTPSTSGTGSGGGVDPKILDMFNKASDEYLNNLDKIQMKATKIRDVILDWLGFTDGTYTNLKLIGVFLGINILTKLLSGYKSIKNIKNLLSGGNKGILDIAKDIYKTNGSNLTSLEKIQSKLYGAGGLIAGYTLINSSSKDIATNGLNASNTIEALAGTFANLLGGFLAGGKLGFIAGVFATIVEAINGATNSTDEFATKLKNLSDKTTELGNSWENTQAKLNSGLDEFKNLELLRDQLDSLVDEQGNVKKGYEGQVQYILKELSEATGVEYKLIDGQIVKYKELKTSIDEALKKKKASLILENYGSQIGQATENIAKAKQTAGEALATIGSLTNKLQKAQAEYDQAAFEGNKVNMMWANIRLQGVKKELAEAQKLYDENQEIIRNNQALIDKYNKMYQLSLDGDIDKLNEFIDYEGVVYGMSTQEAKKYYNEQISLANKNLQELETNRKNYTDEEYERLKEKYSNNLDLLKEYLLNLQLSTAKSLSDLSDDFVKDMGNMAFMGNEKFLEYLEKLPESLRGDFVQRLKDMGYKISENIQKGIDKLNLTANVKVSTKDSDIAEWQKKITSSLTTKVGSSLIGSAKSNIPGKESGGVYSNFKWHDIEQYAGGLNQGLPNVGQLFVAREKGAELVGNLNGHTAVMNNDQIVGSVSNGVYKATRRAMSETRQSQGQQIYNIYLDEEHKIGTYTLEQLQNMAISNGKPITIGG